MKASKLFAFTASVAAVAVQGAVNSSVFDDVKVWYKGSAGNAVGTADSSVNQVGKAKNLPQLGDASSSMHGGSYYWWGWRMSYENQPVYCPYANVTLDSTPCMVIASPVSTNSMETVTINGVETASPSSASSFRKILLAAAGARLRPVSRTLAEAPSISSFSRTALRLALMDSRA